MFDGKICVYVMTSLFSSSPYYPEDLHLKILVLVRASRYILHIAIKALAAISDVFRKNKNEQYCSTFLNAKIRVGLLIDEKIYFYGIF